MLIQSVLTSRITTKRKREKYIAHASKVLPHTCTHKTCTTHAIAQAFCAYCLSVPFDCGSFSRQQTIAKRYFIQM